ncbi:MAG: protein kinase, partial [Myxococcota bacterium]|nr:protein kinase [Myxococcota bacterium]
MTNSSITQPPEGAMDTMLMPSVKSAVGIVVDGRYRLDELLGEGGMGAVYRGTHVLMGKPVAIKLIHAELAHLPEVVARFEREARSASLLKDPHCISVTDFGKSPEGMLYLVMELLEGEDLHSRVQSGISLSTEQALRIVKEVGVALAHAHSVGVVHRDLKPENIMLVRHGDEEDFAKVIDFGIARIADSTNGGDDRLTRAGFVLGTPAYLSPEQALGEVADHRADLYALGVILYEALSGHQPYSGDSAMDVVTHHLSSPVPRLPRQRYTPELQAIVDKAMAKSPTQRFQSAAELVEAIDGLPVWALVSSPSWVNRIVPTKFEDKLRLVANSMQRRYRALPPKTRRFAPYVAGAVGLAVALIIGLAVGDDVEVPDPSSNKALMVVESPGVDEKEIKAMLERADTQLRGGLAKEAVITAKEILSKSPGQWSAQLLLGHAKFAQ